MRKIVSIMIALVLTISLIGCSNNNGNTNDVIIPNVGNDVSDIMSGDSAENNDNGQIDISDILNGTSQGSNGTDTGSKGDQVDTSNIKLDIFELRVIDCGQADSILLLVGDKVVLIDAGEAKDAKQIVYALDNEGIKEIDLLVATHPHADHIGGMQTIIERYDIVEVLMSPATHTSKTYENLLRALDTEGCDVYEAEIGTEYKFNGLELLVVSPGNEYDDLNNNSIVMVASYGSIDILLTGDAEMEAEKDYVDYLSQIEIIKIGHHGSDTSTSDNLLNVIKPELALISCGADNSYGHPHKAILDKLSKRNISVYRTDLSGDLIIRTDGNTYTLETEVDGEIRIDQVDSSSDAGDSSGNTGTSSGDTGSSNSGDTIVFVAKSGKKYHSTKDCSRLYTSTVVNEYYLSYVKSLGLVECSNCWGY